MNKDEAKEVLLRFCGAAKLSVAGHNQLQHAILILGGENATSDLKLYRPGGETDKQSVMEKEEG